MFIISEISFSIDSTSDLAFIKAILEEFAIEYPVTEPQLVPEGALAKEVCYARDLRTLGQVLEGYSVGKLEIEMGDGRYQVRGQKNRHPEEPIPLTKIIRQWFGF